MADNWKTTILTADGVYFDFADPKPEPITLNAVARGLANTCRFGGQCQPFYSVAQHSVYVSRIVPAELAIVGLLHDAAEAFIGDMPKPLKEMLPDYKAVEARIEAMVFARFGLHLPMPAAVKEADRVALATEQRHLMTNRDQWHWTKGCEPRDDFPAPLGPVEAYREFIQRAVELGMA